MSEAEEVLDIVNDRDEVIGQVGRHDLYTDLEKLGGYVRAACLLIVNSRGQVWIPRRALSQRIKPGGLDYSAGGHVSSGESYQTAVIREAAEEIGLRLQPDDLRELTTVTPEIIGGFYFSRCFVYFSDQTPSYSADEFMSDEWVEPSRLLERLAAGEYAKSSLDVTIQALVEFLKAND